ncbi:hypothetical protein ACIGZJ_04805 [Kitasatospora sp. NPDC052868]|uniref:hypothetical protein n=1 Tax=Kitasatospora sp. NPDC052868 TaxID=3364060 RepID=UPI0037C6C6E1
MALAVAARAVDFARLARHGLFGGAAFPAYLSRTDAGLRALHGQGLEVHLRVLEPADYEDYCEAFGLDPGAAAARVAYAADPELAGEPFVYAGERLAGLLPVLVDDHRARVRISIGCAVLLAAVGEGPRGRSLMGAVMRHVSAVYLALAEGAGEGCHLLTLSCHGPEDGEELATAAELCIEGGRLFAGGRDAEAFCVTLAAGTAARGAGALLLHRDPAAPDGPQVCGWALAEGRLRPMSVREVLDALAEGADRGLPLPPGSAAVPAFALPPFPPSGGGGRGRSEAGGGGGPMA